MTVFAVISWVIVAQMSCIRFVFDWSNFMFPAQYCPFRWGTHSITCPYTCNFLQTCRDTCHPYEIEKYSSQDHFYIIYWVIRHLDYIVHSICRHIHNEKWKHIFCSIRLNWLSNWTRSITLWRRSKFSLCETLLLYSLFSTYTE